MRDTSARRIRWAVFAVAVLAAVSCSVLVAEVLRTRAARAPGCSRASWWRSARCCSRCPASTATPTRSSCSAHPPPAGCWPTADAGLVAARPTLFGHQHVLRLTAHAQDILRAEVSAS